MQRTLSVYDPTRGVEHDVLVDAPDDTPVGELARAMGDMLGPRRGGPTRLDHPPGSSTFTIMIGGVALEPSRRLVDTPLRDGLTVGLGAPAGPDPAEPMGLLEVRVTGGPGAGVVHRLRPGEYGVGADPDGGVPLADPSGPRRALTLLLGVDGRCLLVPEPHADVVVYGACHGMTVELPAGMPGAQPPAVRMRIGAVRLVITRPEQPPCQAALASAGNEQEVHLPPRLPPDPRPVRFRLPAAPMEPARVPVPILVTVLPVLAAVGMAALLRTYYLLLFAAVAPLSVLGSQLGGHRHRTRAYRQAVADHRRDRAEVEAAAEAALAREVSARRRAAPDPAELLLTAVGPRQGLWVRRPEDSDFLLVRVGTANLPSQVLLEDPAAPEHRRQTPRIAVDVPVTLPLAELGVVGVAGGGGLAQVVGGWLVAQAAVLHSPAHLRIFLLGGPSAAEVWRWSRWLPHCRRPGGRVGSVLVGFDEQTRSRRLAELVALISAREQTHRSFSSGMRTPTARTQTARTRMSTERSVADSGGDHVLVVVDGAQAMRPDPPMLTLLRDGPPVGVLVVCLADDPRLLPAECRSVVESARDRFHLATTDGGDVTGICPDLVDLSSLSSLHGLGSSLHGLDGTGASRGAAAWFERLARALAPLRDPRSNGGSDARLPTQARLVDLLGIPPASARAIAQHWVTAARATQVPIGVGVDGPIILDLRRDGPHALVAGTTGAGKSELLQSLVVGLAARTRPDETTFVLVDYKGGSAFAECADLPHTVGFVTDLDGHLVRRALDSLGTELRRREVLLAAVGAKDVDDYARLAADQHSRHREPLPRLVLVVDEFAALVQELPDFVTGLVSLAGRGRSLGIHLVLATQRPAGAISPEIRANTNLRVALRVTDPADSVDVIAVPDAASLPGAVPGRAIARVGSAPPVTFQTARVAGFRPSRTPADRRRPVVTPLPWPPIDPPADGPAQGAATDHRDADATETDLRVLVRSIRQAARAARIPPPRRPWLPPLPERIPLDLLARPPARSARPTTAALRPAPTIPAVPLGLGDLPGAQTQAAFAIELDDAGHLLIAGAARSGRSTALRTFAGALVVTTRPADVHLYALDCGDGALAPLAALPHTGAVVPLGAAERVYRLLSRLSAEVDARQEMLARDGHADLPEARRAARRRGEPAPPCLVLLLDGYEGFLAAFEDVDGGLAIDRLLRLLRDGPAVGLRILVTTDRRGLTGRLVSAIGSRLMLRLADAADYALAGLPGVRTPPRQPPGRGLLIGPMRDALVSGPDRVDDGRGDDRIQPVEVQIALLAADPAGSAQVAALRELSTRAAGHHAARNGQSRPFRVGVLPTRVTPRDIADADPPPPRQSEAVPTTGQALMTGPRALAATLGIGGDELTPIDVDLAADGPGFLIAGPPRSGRSSALLTLATGLLERGTRLAVVTPRPSPLRALAGRTGVAGVADSADLDAAADQVAGWLDRARAAEPVVMVVDDAELLVDTRLAAVMSTFLRTARDLGSGLLIAGTTDDLAAAFRGPLVDSRRSRCGLVLAPRGPGDGELFGVRLSRVVGGPVPAGRGLLLQRGLVTPVQVTMSTRPGSVQVDDSPPSDHSSGRSPA